MPEPDRAAGRAAGAVRPISFEVGYTRYAEGSVLARCGETWVLCNASVEDRVPRHCEEFGRGWVTAEYAMLPRATHTRGDRDGRRGPPRGRTLEIQRLIGRSLRAVVDLEAMPGFTVRLDCDVLQADGGTRTTAISGSYLALHLALAGLVEEGLVQEHPARDGVAAISVGVVDGQVLADLDYSEDSRAEVDLNLVTDWSGRIVEVQGTAEADPFPRQQLEAMLDLGIPAIESVAGLQRAALEAQASGSAEA